MKTAAVFDAQFMHNLGVIAQSETLAKRLVKYVTRLAKPAADPTLMTREEFMTKVDEAEQQIERGEGKTFSDIDQMNAWLNSL
ncbi:MAG: hypothetical protein IJ618_06020 [Prevotella sp.]|nr:hypothetical protein [Prevotella sp.]